MKVDDNPFPGDQNMVDAGLFKGKTKVLTSTESKEAGIVDPKMQILADEYREILCRAKEPIRVGGDVKSRDDKATSYISDSVE